MDMLHDRKFPLRLCRVGNWEHMRTRSDVFHFVELTHGASMKDGWMKI